MHQDIATSNEKSTDKNKTRKKILLSLLCSSSFVITVILQPIISYYISNEGEFWFQLKDIIGAVLLLAIAVLLGLFILFIFLPDRGKINPYIILIGFICAITICSYVQYQFMSSYLPILTGDEIDWSLYSGWNIGSIALWIGMISLCIFIAIKKNRFGRKLFVCIFSFLFMIEAIALGLELITAKHENIRENAYFSTEGLLETSDAGNVVVIVSDTFEGTYMNEILEYYPDYKELLNDCTYFDNTTGISVFTYYSFAKLLTGQDFPMGKGDQGGIQWCFENQTIIDQVKNNGWDIAYYTTFSPTKNVSTKIINYADKELKPDNKASWEIAINLWKNTLFRSVPQPIKPQFIVLSEKYEQIKVKNAENKSVPEPYSEDDSKIYNDLLQNGLKKSDGNASKYSIIHLKGLHYPVETDDEFNRVNYSEEISHHERMIIAGRASLNFLRLYLDKLKSAGTYDNTTVILTADHGFNMRFYPVFIVKEANSTQKEFCVNSTPLSLQEDYCNIIQRLTKGVSFTNILNEMNISDDRIRTTLDYFTEDGNYASSTTRRSIVSIQGKACELDSYHYERDEFLMDNTFSGNYQIGDYIMHNGIPDNDSVKIYGIIRDRKAIWGHSAIFDIAFDRVKDRTLVLNAFLANCTDRDQRIVIRVNDILVTTIMIEKNEEKEIKVKLPQSHGDRIILEIDVPDAIKRDQEVESVLGWAEHSSIYFTDLWLTEE